MANAFNTQQFNVTLAITNAAGVPATVDGVPVWATSDATIVNVTAAADGMSAVAPCVAPGTARLTVTADADLGAGIVTITGVSEDIIVTVDPANLASVVTLNLGPAVAKA
jgi:hypothetical protein